MVHLMLGVLYQKYEKTTDTHDSKMTSEDNRHPRLQDALLVPVKGKKLMDVKIGECQAGY